MYAYFFNIRYPTLLNFVKGNKKSGASRKMHRFIYVS